MGVTGSDTPSGSQTVGGAPPSAGAGRSDGARFRRTPPSTDGSRRGVHAHSDLTGGPRRPLATPTTVAPGPPQRGPLPSAGDERCEDDGRASIAARNERGAERARSPAVNMEEQPGPGSAEAAYADRFATESPVLTATRARLAHRPR